jgi:hypothetical protein
MAGISTTSVEQQKAGLHAGCIALIRGKGGYPGAIEHVVLLRGMPEAEARRWVHSLPASKPAEMFTAS